MEDSIDSLKYFVYKIQHEKMINKTKNFSRQDFINRLIQREKENLYLKTRISILKKKIVAIIIN